MIFIGEIGFKKDEIDCLSTHCKYLISKCTTMAVSNERFRFFCDYCSQQQCSIKKKLNGKCHTTLGCIFLVDKYIQCTENINFLFF